MLKVYLRKLRKASNQTSIGDYLQKHNSVRDLYVPIPPLSPARTSNDRMNETRTAALYAQTLHCEKEQKEL
jgi:hypothetical protein